ncbi:hypothetical protein AAGV33_12265 [Flavobacterium sp. FBOR7N2.3]|uniref:Uncharacterized protein n=1 Tax=Flavobacterium magnesitis TaxID=3138077 RepID=A0ABV4TQK3_9FLAO
MSHEHPDKKELKVKYKADFKKIQDFVNTFDPCGLIFGGAPDNEYDCLTSHLISGVYTNKSRQDLKEIILHEINDHFGTPDLLIIKKPHKTEFYKDLDKLLDKLESIKPSH